MLSDHPRSPSEPPQRSSIVGFLVLLVIALGLGVTFFEGIRAMVWSWNVEPEYSHGYLIPLISLYLLAIRFGALRSTDTQASWAGFAVLVVAMLAFVFGELSSLYVIVQYGFILAVWGCALALVGWRGVRMIWPALVFLLFMVPLPFFLRYNLSSQLQLISSELGAGILRLMGVSVYLQGNVIDLGSYKLQVVEACAGLRYLFPLMSFGLLAAVLFRGPVWQRWVLFLSSVPIAIFMNSFRIAVTGVLVNRFGTEAAEGFLHYFEGWVIFAACLALMVLEMALFARFNGKRLDDIFDLELPERSDFQGIGKWGPPAPPVVAVAVLSAVCAFLAVGVLKGREENIPTVPALSTFPLALGEWRGVESTIGDQELEVLKLTDYLMANFSRSAVPEPVELYVAYYESQRKGASVHSPKGCLPGGGWEMNQSAEFEVPAVGPNGESLRVNRTLISMGEQRMLVYYWFMQRGRNITNEYLVKWFIFWDSITKQRTDGALVRLLTPIGVDEDPAAADQRLAEFLAVAQPRLYYHIPQSDALVGEQTSIQP